MTRASKAPVNPPQKLANRLRKKAHQTVLAALQQAAKLAAKADGTCAGYGLDGDGDAYCYEEDGGSWVVFCQGGETYALECASFSDTASCGSVDDLIDCAIAPTETVDPSLDDDVGQTADADEGCQNEGAADCEDGYVVFCQDGELHELDCASFSDAQGEHGTCGASDGHVTCGFDE